MPALKTPAGRAAAIPVRESLKLQHAEAEALKGKNLNVECRGPADGDLALPVDGMVRWPSTKVSTMQRRFGSTSSRSLRSATRLGPVGSTIVAEVFVGLVHGDTGSYLCTKKNWRPTLPSATSGTFLMTDLLRMSMRSDPNCKRRRTPLHPLLPGGRRCTRRAGRGLERARRSSDQDGAGSGGWTASRPMFRPRVAD